MSVVLFYVYIDILPTLIYNLDGQVLNPHPLIMRTKIRRRRKLHVDKNKDVSNDSRSSTTEPEPPRLRRRGDLSNELSQTSYTLSILPTLPPSQNYPRSPDLQAIQAGELSASRQGVSDQISEYDPDWTFTTIFPQGRPYRRGEM